MPDEVMAAPPPEGYSRKRVVIGKTVAGPEKEVYHFVRRGREVLHRGSLAECEAFVDNGLKAPKKGAAPKPKAKAKAKAKK